MSPHTKASPTLNDWNEMSPPAAKAELLTVPSSRDKEGGGENKNVRIRTWRDSARLVTWGLFLNHWCPSSAPVLSL